jgi:putative hemolysin
MKPRVIFIAALLAACGALLTACPSRYGDMAPRHALSWHQTNSLDNPSKPLPSAYPVAEVME